MSIGTTLRSSILLAGALCFAVPASAQLAPPTLLGPFGPGQPSNPTYRWQAVNGASLYVLAVNRWGSSFYTSPPISQSSCSQDICTFVPPVTHPLGLYAWAVFACDSTCEQSAMSDTASFNVGYPPSSAVTLISPEGNGYSTNPEYEWYPVNDATGYYLYIATPTPIAKTYTNAICAATCAVTPTESLAAGTYAWIVIALNSAGTGPLGSANIFSVGTPVAPPTPRSPTGLAFTGIPTYEWDPVDGATSYQVALYNGSLTLLDFETVNASTGCGAFTCTHVLGFPALSSGLYYWFVRAMNPAGGPWSSYTSFYVVNAVPPAPSPQGPASSGHPSNPEYVWSDAGVALQYELQIDGPTGPIQKTYAASSICQGGTCSATADLLWPGSYSWSVRGSNPIGPGASSVSTNFGVSSPLAGGEEHTLALLPDATVWSWGNGSALGDGSGQRHLPGGSAPVAGGIVTLAAGGEHSVALKNDGSLLVWGRNNVGQLGDGTQQPRTTPIPGPSFVEDVVAIAAGDQHTLALTSDGSLFAWGSDGNGQLGNGPPTPGMPTFSLNKVPVNLANVIAIAAGGNHSLAVTSDQRVWAWGANASAQIGDGTTEDRDDPVLVDGLSGITAVAAGSLHSVALREDGQVFCWGEGDFGRLGNGTTLQRIAPAPSLLSNAVAIAAGERHTLAVDRLGKVWAWGNQTEGQVGDGTNAGTVSTPVQLSEPTDVVNVAAGSFHSLAVSSNGVIWGWGRNNFGEIGDGTTVKRLQPVRVSENNFAWKAGTPRFAIAPGTYNNNLTVGVDSLSPSTTIRFTTDGSDPTSSSEAVVNGVVEVQQSVTLKAKAFDHPSLQDSNVAEASYELRVPTPQLTPLGNTYTSPVTVSMTVGGVTNYQIRYTLNGLEPDESSTLYSDPVSVSTTTTVRARAFKTGWTPSITSPPQTYTMNFGTLPPPILSPTPPAAAIGELTVTLESIPGAAIRYTTNGSDPTGNSNLYAGPLTLFATTNLKARAFHSDYLQSPVAPGTYTVKVPDSQMTPGTGTYAAGQTVTISNSLAGATTHYTLDGSTPTTSDPSIASGGSITLLASFDLRVKAFKAGCEPSDVVNHTYTVTGSITPKVIAAGRMHSLAIRNENGWAWGLNGDGQLGDGTTTTPQKSPKSISAFAPVADIDGGESHTIALLTDGTVKGSGKNGEGQLGKGSFSTLETTPVVAQGLTGVTAVAAGGVHSLALSNGLVYSFGRNDDGQLGLGSRVDQPTPTPAPGLAGVTAIDAGMNHSIVLAGGNVWTFGKNNFGQLGIDSTVPDSLVPVQVTTLSDVIAIAAGQDHNLALTSDLTLWAWGSGGSGRLGDGFTTTRWKPVQVITQGGAQFAGMTHVVAIGAGNFHSLAVRADGSLWGFGLNSSQQLTSLLPDPNATRWAQPVGGVSGVVSAAGGWGHSLAVTASGELWGWGWNQDGQVGIGSTQTPLGIPLPLSIANLDWRVAKPVISPAGGLHLISPPEASLPVSVTSDTPEAIVRYTTNGLDPTSSDPEVVGGTVDVTQSLSLKARAFKSGMPDSLVAEQVYELKPTPPTFTPPQNTYPTNQSVTISEPPEGLVVRYTTDGTLPTESSTAYSGAIPVTQTTTFRAAVFGDGWTTSTPASATYTLKVATPEINPPGGAFPATQPVTVTGATPGATLHYTLDGSEPTQSSPVVASGETVAVTHSATLKVRGFNGLGWSPSDLALGTYDVSQGMVAAPTFNPPPATYAQPQTVTLVSATAGSVIRYTLDGSVPNAASAVFTGPIGIDGSADLKAKAFKSGWTPSSTTEGAYVIDLPNAVAPVTLSVRAGSYATKQTVILSTPTPGATIHYTTNGDAPTTSDDWVLSPGTVPVTWSQVLKAFAVKSSMTDSPVRRADYRITGAIAAGHSHALGLTTSGTVLSWGLNTTGALGRPSEPAQTPAPIEAPGLLDNVIAIAANGDGQSSATSFALKSDLSLWGWGSGSLGKLGYDPNGQPLADQPLPVPVSTTTGMTNVVAVAAGRFHTLALTSAKEVWAWGSQSSGALGDGAQSGQVPLPKKVTHESLVDVVAIAAGSSYSLALLGDGKVVSWGAYQHGQLGRGTTDLGLTPTIIPNLTGVTAIAAGHNHAFAIASDGAGPSALWVWGENSASGRLGDGSSTDRLSPIRVAESIRAVAAHANASLVVRENPGYLNAVMGAGQHHGNRLNLGAFGTTRRDLGAKDSTTRFTTILTDDVLDVSAGSRIQLALKSDTTVREWGEQQLLPSPLADGLVLGDPTAGGDDPDGDGLSTAEEWLLGTDPFDSDTNDDGVPDGVALASNLSATDPDMDGDGVLNAAERLQGTSPFHADTDGDGVNDAADAFPLDPARTAAPEPTPGDTTPPGMTLTDPTNATLISSIPP